MLEGRSLELTGASGHLGNTFLTQGATRIVVVFPGFMGGWSTPATYYPVLALLDRGYDALCLDSIYREHPAAAVLKADSAAAVAATKHAGDYKSTLAMGKSLGTIAMAELLLDGTLEQSSPTIWLTPLLGDQRVQTAIASLKARALFVIGTEDPHFDQASLDSLSARGHLAVVIPRANHGLAVDGDASASADVPRRLVDAVHGYVLGQTTGARFRSQ